jgi:ferredoxin
MSKKHVKRRFRLTFPGYLTDQPVLYQLVRDFELVINIRQARVLSDQRGMVVLEMQGPAETLDQAVAFLQGLAIEVAERDQELGWDPDACVDCGACLPVCEPQALYRIEETGRVSLDRSRCTLCGRCIDVCVYGAVWIEQ